MQTVDSVWASLFGVSGTLLEYKYSIEDSNGNATEYTEEDIESHTVTSGLFDEFGVGNAQIGKLDLQVWADDIPKGAKISIYARLVNSDLNLQSEWIPRGVYWTNKRSEDDGLWTLEAYDAMRKADKIWVPDQSLEFPLGMSDAVNHFCTLLGIELDSRCGLSNACPIDYPANDYTIRNILEFIAAAHAGNWTITPEGKLRLVEAYAHPTTTFVVAEDAMEMGDSKATDPVSKIILLVDSENCYESGDDTGLSLEVTCPYGSQNLADHLLDLMRGTVYHPYEASAAAVNPAYELGDGVEVFGVTGIIARCVDNSDGFPDISAPGSSDEQEDEYPTEGPLTQAINRKLAETNSKISKTSEEILLQVENTNGNVSKIQQTVDGITLEVTEQFGSSGNTTASIKLKVGDKEMAGQILLSGNVNISGSLSVSELYTDLGEISNLAVEKLITSRRIPRRLTLDKSDDNYIRIEGQNLQFITAVTDGDTEQAVNPNGELIYWEQDPYADGVIIGSDGYPYKDGVRIWTTTTETEWPVWVFVYTEHVKREISFDDQNPKAPLDTFGAGYGNADPDQGKGFIQKTTESMDLWLLTSKGEKHGIFAGDDYTDIKGLRKTRSLDFSGWDAGTFRETVDGINTAIAYGVEFDTQGRPVKITDESGHMTEITW